MQIDESPAGDWALNGSAAYFSLPGGQGLRRADVTGRGRALGAEDQRVVSRAFTGTGAPEALHRTRPWPSSCG